MDCVWAIRTIQNLCSVASSKVGLDTCAMLSVLSTAALRKDYEEQSAAVGATLLHLAHSPNTPSSVQKIYCDSLAMVGLWQQTLASAGTVQEEIWYRLVRCQHILLQGG